MTDLTPTPNSHSMRVSDAEREFVADALREAAAEGRIDFAELDERLDGTYSAKTYADLSPLVHDLPGVAVPAPAGMPESRSTVAPATDDRDVQRFDSSTAVMGSQERVGSWEVGPGHRAFAMMGEVVIDLREAHFSQPETVITATAVMGQVTVIVNASTRVRVEGNGFLGEFGQKRDRVGAYVDDSSPLVRVRGAAVMGAVEVVRRAQRADEGWRRWFGR